MSLRLVAELLLTCFNLTVKIKVTLRKGLQIYKPSDMGKASVNRKETSTILLPLNTLLGHGC